MALVYNWRVRPAAPGMRRSLWLLWSVFAANHRWAMAWGQEGLRRELARQDAR